MTNRESENSNKKEFIEPVVVTTISIWFLLEICKASLSFVVQRCLGWWWDHRKDSNGKPNDRGTGQEVSGPQQGEET